MEQFCNKCESDNLIFGNFDYAGEFASLGYACQDCGHGGIFYYDVTYNITNKHFIKNENKEDRKEKQT